jgi:hypothetical protein
MGGAGGVGEVEIVVRGAIYIWGRVASMVWKQINYSAK